MGASEAKSRMLVGSSGSTEGSRSAKARTCAKAPRTAWTAAMVRLPSGHGGEGVRFSRVLARAGPSERTVRHEFGGEQGWGTPRVRPVQMRDDVGGEDARGPQHRFDPVQAHAVGGTGPARCEVRPSRLQEGAQHRGPDGRGLDSPPSLPGERCERVGAVVKVAQDDIVRRVRPLIGGKSRCWQHLVDIGPYRATQRRYNAETKVRLRLCTQCMRRYEHTGRVRNGPFGAAQGTIEATTASRSTTSVWMLASRKNAGAVPAPRPRQRAVCGFGCRKAVVSINACAHARESHS
eukprot:3550197-Prymnesium_polylepis.1